MTASNQQSYQAGYQAALADIARALDEGGEDGARQWIASNSS
jgi:hypothetical protein